jgi:hypothetical protein
MKANTNKGIIGKPKKTASSTYERTPWCGNFSEEELDRPGGLLLAALIKCANDRRLLFKDMAKELGVTYGYINQLSGVPTFFRGERADLARNPVLNLLRVA